MTQSREVLVNAGGANIGVYELARTYALVEISESLAQISERLQELNQSQITIAKKLHALDVDIREF